MKYEIEQMRRHNSIQGYVITELTDVHWECNGLLDMRRNPKTYFEKFASINADDVLVPLWERLAVASGETYALPVLFSHYSAREVAGAMLEWAVISNQCTVTSGRLPVGRCASFDVTDLGVVTFSAPEMERPTQAQLALRLVSKGEVLARTEQELLVLPKNSHAPQVVGLYAPDFKEFFAGAGLPTVADLSAAAIAVVSTLDDACREFILRGGKVLFLAEQPEALQAAIPGLTLAARAGTSWQGDWASSFGWHRFEQIPTGGVVDFSFAGLTPEVVLHGFAPRDFEREVYAGLFVGWLHKPIPTIARKRLGRGELLVSTFCLRENLKANPLARWLLWELLRLLSK